MKVKIYYMSGTGNTRRAAELFQLQLNSIKTECEIANWVEGEFEGWDEADAFGFAAPTHSFREPTPFRKKLKELPKIVGKKIPVFIINTCEGTLGNFYYRVGKILRKKGCNIVGTFTLFSPSNVLMWPKSLKRSKDKLTIEHQQNFMSFAKNLPELIEKNDPAKVNHSWIWGIFAKMVGDRNLRAMIRWKIKVDELKCTKCGICAKSCMAQCITLDPFPIFNIKECVVCLACINLCPVDALDSKNSRGEERYRGPGKLKVQPI